MPRKQVGAIDAELLAEVDKRAEWLGQTRRVFIERTLQKRLANPDVKLNFRRDAEAGEPVYVNLAEPRARSTAQVKRGVQPRPKGGKR